MEKSAKELEFSKQKHAPSLDPSTASEEEEEEEMEEKVDGNDDYED